jgi:hypothetical protein
LTAQAAASTGADLDRAAVDWLLDSREPAIGLMARRDLLKEGVGESARAQVLEGPWVRQLLTGQQADGSFGVHPYRKWSGAHWRLVSLVELQVPAGESRTVAAANTVLDWLCSNAHRKSIQTINGLARRCASQEGNALAVACRFGLARDERTSTLARSLVEWQWPDGGWNCDVQASGRRSSFNETLIPAWGTSSTPQSPAIGQRAWAAYRAAELLLDHNLYRSIATGRTIDQRWVGLHYPPYWHYDILHALLVLSRMGLATDPRSADALDIVERRRRPDGLWHANGSWWRPSNRPDSAADVVDWGRRGPNQMITLNAMRVLTAAGRVEPLGSA